jgi:two-component system response regulator RegA
MVLETRNKKLLLVEDDKGLREVLIEELQERGMQVQAFSQTPELPQVEKADWALLDLRVGSENSMEFLKLLKTQQPQIKIVMMSGFGSVASAVKAMQLGAHNFISKPVTVDMILKAFIDSDPNEIDEAPEQEISLARMEREYIDYVLQSSDGNITQAAKKLGLHRQSLQRKLRKNIPNK